MYISEIVDGSAVAFEDILNTSRKNNSKAKISGILLRDNRSFLQFLEGDRDQLGRCMLRIAGDHRHAGVTMLLSLPTEMMFFDRWSLGAVKLPNKKRSLMAFASMLSESSLEEKLTLVDNMCIEATQDLG